MIYYSIAHLQWQINKLTGVEKIIQIDWETAVASLQKRGGAFPNSVLWPISVAT